MDAASSPERCAAPLRAVLSAFEVAALLGVESRALLKQVRAGKIPAARRSFDQTGYDFDWRDVQDMITTRLAPGPDQRQALRDLLGLRAGTRRSENGVILDAHHHRWNRSPVRWCPADELLDDELTAALERARTVLGEGMADPERFDLWGITNANGLTHTDVMLRLGYGSWELLCAPSPDEDDAPELDLRDPVVALRQAAEDLGRPPTHAGFDAWAAKAGCPLRAAGVRAQFGGVWSAAIRAADLTA